MKDYNENISRNCNYNCILATGIVGINNVSTQGNNNDFIGNDTTMTMNATLPTTIISNAT